MLSDLEAVIEAAGLGPVGLFGFFNSCLYALLYAARRPEQVERLALWGVSARGDAPMAAPQTQALLGLIEADWELFTETAAHLWMGWSAGESARKAAAVFRMAATPAGARALLSAAAAVDVTAQLEEVAAPALILQRRDAVAMRMDLAQELAAGLPEGRLVVFEGESPSPYMGETKPILDALSEFFAGGQLQAGRAAGGAAAALSAREREVLALVAEGLSNREIAERLVVSVATVKTHVTNTLGKLEAKNRTQAVARGRDLGLLG